ncbi:hypothetical protein, partial [Anaerobutyricum hallii]|uniref:hypothetical protein n=1 Tax=Anaerobutyricum hallii TaxID=39488 RepID=UPI00242C9848
VISGHFFSQGTYDLPCTYDTTNDEIVTQIKNSKEISEDFLPTKGEFFEISNQKIQKYITSLEKQLIKIDTVDTV